MGSIRALFTKAARRRPHVGLNRGGTAATFETLETRRALAVVPVKLGTPNDVLTTDPHRSGALFNGVTYFAARGVAGKASETDAGIELWRTDNTPAGTYRLKDINPGSKGSDPENFKVVGSTLYFTADDGFHGRELWKTDGTAAGTVMVMDINGNGEVVLGTGLAYTDSSNPNAFADVNGTLFFTAEAGLSGRELWKSNGTAAGTVMVKDIDPSGTSEPMHLTRVGTMLMFSADDGVHGRELWKSDGTAAGTVLVKDIQPGPEGSAPGFIDGDGLFHNPSPFVPLNGAVYFVASEDQGSSYRESLWRSDGTAGGTTKLMDGGVRQLTLANGFVFFTEGPDGDAGDRRLWRTDGTSAGTTMLRDFGAGWLLSNLSNVNGTLLLQAFLFDEDRREFAAELWRSNGMAAGTVRVTELVKRTTLVDDSDQGAVASMVSPAVVRPDGLYFGNVGSSDGVLNPKKARLALWKSDGTAAGTAEVRSALSSQFVMPLWSRLDRGTWYSDGPLQVAAVDNSNGAIYRFLPPRATPDVNGDGRADVISRDVVTGEVVAEIRGREGALRETRLLGTEPLSLVTNGGFESPVAAAQQLVTYGTGQSIGKWRVVEGDVQIKGSGYWQHAGGVQSLDLNGTQRGGLEQDVATTPGAVYDLSLQLSGNPDGGSAVKAVDIYWGPAGSQKLVKQVTFSTAGWSKTSMGWMSVKLPDLKATGSLMRLTIVSRTSGEYGPVIDDVRLVPGGSANRVFVAAADVTGDGVADLIWRRPGTGAHTVWVMAANGTVVARHTLSSNANLSLAATGDYDADSREDLVWRNATTGGHTMWAMGEGLSSVKTALGASASLQIVAADPRFDANDDGKTDLIWRNPATNATTLWMMNGALFASTVAMANGSTKDVIAGAGDFNGDGHGDVLWRSSSTGKVTQQLMRNGAVVSSAVIGGSLGESVIWTGDVNGDRRTDIVWNTASTGRNVTKLMNGAVSQATWAALGNSTRRFLIRRPGG
jgi:choice-of-anchor C domain-containing protein